MGVESSRVQFEASGILCICFLLFHYIILLSFISICYVELLKALRQAASLSPRCPPCRLWPCRWLHEGSQSPRRKGFKGFFKGLILKRYQGFTGFYVRGLGV